MTRTVIFDFDGTLALGDGPIRAYARSLAAELDSPQAEAEALAALDAFEAGLTDARDGYHAVREVAERHGIDGDGVRRAYLRSREVLATDAAPIHAPEGLSDFLARLAEHARLVLVTNSPPIRIDEALVELGAAAHLAAVVCDARKPEGITTVVEDAIARGPVLSVGDIYAYDLEPAARLGADTAAVGVSAGQVRDRVTMAAERLEDLYDAIEAWAARG